MVGLILSAKGRGGYATEHCGQKIRPRREGRGTLEIAVESEGRGTRFGASYSSAKPTVDRGPQLAAGARRCPHEEPSHQPHRRRRRRRNCIKSGRNGLANLGRPCWI